MNTTDLVEVVAKTHKLTKVQAKAVVGTVFSTIKTAVKKKQSVQIAEFGTYKVTTRKARNGVNPATRAKIKIPSRKVVKFTAGKALKAVLSK
jgi:DNA-binding protein HU-beta